MEFSLPIGITADRSGNIYVCGGSVTTFIEVITPDIQRSRVILNKTSLDLVGICYDRDSDKLYVFDKIQGKVLRYKIEHSGTVQGLMKALMFPPTTET